MIGLLARLLAVFVALAACAAAALFVYTALGSGPSISRALPINWDAPVSGDATRVTFTIEPGQSASTVGAELQRRGLIRSALAFRWEVESRGLGSKLEAGDYELSPSMSTGEIVAALARGATRRGVTVAIPEGLRAEQVAQRIEAVGLARSEDVLRLVREPREHGITPPDPTAASLEGYLFPDTYQFDPGATASDIVATMLRQFDRRFDDALRGQAASRHLTVHQAVTLASIVERETARPEERPLVASVYLNRLAAGMKLDADPTVQYAVASLDLASAAGYEYWKRDLSTDDLQVSSPYNTYRTIGLPPGPICSPGLSALQAAVSPAQTAYLYFVARGDGSHAFAETNEEHQANVLKYASR